MKRFFTAAAVAALFVAPASAADLKGSAKDDVFAAPSSDKVINWSGIYVGGFGGYTSSNDDMELGTVPTFASIEANGYNDHGLIAGISAGINAQKDRFVFGVAGDYGLSNSEFKETLTYGIKSLSGTIEDDRFWRLYGKLGYAFGERHDTLLYVLGGWGQSDVTYRLSGVGSVDKTFNGYVAGVGLTHALNNLVSFGLEYQYFDGGKETIASGTGWKLDDDRETHQIMGRINLTVGPGLFGY